MAWMLLIFSASSDPKSAQHSSRIIAPLLRWLMPDISEASLNRAVFTVRKIAHVAEYAVLAFLLWRAWRKPVKRDPRSWRWSEAAFALSVATLYSASDEIHQAFVPTRQGRTADVLIDSAGAALGLMLVWAFGRWRHDW
jgi:VanZ family protein